MKYRERILVLVVCIIGLLWSLTITDVQTSAWAFLFCATGSVVAYLLVRRLDLLAEQVEQGQAELQALRAELQRYTSDSSGSSSAPPDSEE